MATLARLRDSNPDAPLTILPAMIRVSLLAVALCTAAACSKEHDYDVPASSSLAPPETPPVAMTWRYVVAPQSTTHVDMTGAKQHIQGGTSAATGSLDIVGNDLPQSRGSVMVDLSTFSTNTFGNQDDAAQTKQAQSWLEAAKPPMRWASLAIRSIDGLSASDVSKVTPTKDGSDDVRTVTMTVHGDLLLHGSKVEEDCPVDIRFRYPSGAAADSKPARIEITSKEPMRVVLKDVNVQPRDAHGKLGQWTADLLAKVAPSADVTVSLVATPAM
jgi:hypothetical protein